MVQVLVVEDSITTRRFLADLINRMPGLMVCGEASTGAEAIQLAHEMRPGVISMDLHMPGLDGVEATKQIMTTLPTPIVIVSSGVGQREVDIAMLAIEAGALAAIEKPTAIPQDEQKRQNYLRMLRLMAGVRVIRRHRMPEISMPPLAANPKALPEIVVIGASAGGPGAVAHILSRLPSDFPIPVVVVQHLGGEFVPGFANWLGRRCEIPVRVAMEGEYPNAGTVWIAPGNFHIQLNRTGQFVLNSDKGTARHQPSINYLFQSVADVYGSHALAVLLTGMGDDGADGMGVLRARGARTIAQDEETSIVFGMPAAAIDRGAAEYVLPLHEIPQALLALAGLR